MKKEMIDFIEENTLSPFNPTRTQLKNPPKSIYKTRDGKSTHTRLLTKISQHFNFPDTGNLLHFFEFTNDSNKIKERQEFFNQIKQIGKKDNEFLRQIKKPREWWKPEYDVTVVTEDSETFTALKERGCPSTLLISETDVSLLESCDVVQVINCNDYGIALESLPQAVFLKSKDEAYLERYLERLSGWKENIQTLAQGVLSQKLKILVEELIPLLNLTASTEDKTLTRDEAELKVQRINEEVSEGMKSLTISGSDLVAMMSNGKIPQEIKSLIETALINHNLPREIVELGMPVKIDEEELEKKLKEQDSNKFSSKAEKIKENSDILKEIPKKLKELSQELLIFDFITGMSQFIKQETIPPITSNQIKISNSKNEFLKNPQPISFELNEEYKCSILTGANSGGKTTLLEHLIQLISMHQIGIPTTGNVELPLFEEVYYFAKNKGSINKGAFENLLTQMSRIKPGKRTLILADEIESVTEPGVAGKIISATAEFYIDQNCYLVIATHLGHEIQKSIPKKTRIDGIEAKGLTKDFELIVDHNPVLGRLAHSTPELIVEKMANSNQLPYFKHLNDSLKKE